MFNIDDDVILLMKKYIEENDNANKISYSVRIIQELSFHVIDNFAFKIINNEKDRIRLSQAYNGLAYNSLLKHSYEDAIDYLDKAIELSDDEDIEDICRLYINKAEVLYECNRINDALTCFDKAEKLDEKIKEKNSLLFDKIKRNL